ncbi:MAG: hypothetical protein ACXWGX_05540, partial [Usitatibacter sp.]
REDRRDRATESGPSSLLPRQRAWEAGAMSAVISCAEVTKCYETRQPDSLALAGVDLAIEPGELVAIMGPSGCFFLVAAIADRLA